MVTDPRRPSTAWALEEHSLKAINFAAVDTSKLASATNLMGWLWLTNLRQGLHQLNEHLLYRKSTHLDTSTQTVLFSMNLPPKLKSKPGIFQQLWPLRLYIISCTYNHENKVSTTYQQRLNKGDKIRNRSINHLILTFKMWYTQSTGNEGMGCWLWDKLEKLLHSPIISTDTIQH